MTLRVLALLVVAAGCGPQVPQMLPPAPAMPPVPKPPVRPLPPGIFWESDLWTRPPGATFDATSCPYGPRTAECLPFTQPAVRAVAVDGQRLAMLVELDTFYRTLACELVVSDDLGVTAKRFPMVASGSQTPARIVLTGGRVFVLTASSWEGGGQMVEVDVATGAVTARGAVPDMFAAVGGGFLTSVGPAGESAVRIARLDLATNESTQRDVACGGACDARARFRSNDGDLFQASMKGCLASVHASGGALTTSCQNGLAQGLPLSPVGSSTVEFRFDGALYEPSFLTAVTDQFVPAAAPQEFAPTEGVRYVNDHVLLVRTATYAYGTEKIIRAQPGKKLEQAELQLGDGCLGLNWYSTINGCREQLVAIEPVGDRALLVVTTDEFLKDPQRSRRQVVLRWNDAPFVPRAYP